MKRSVTITIPADPTQPTKVEANGYEGVGCEQATGLIERAMGRRLSDTKKQEFYKIPDRVEQTNQQLEDDLGD